MGLINEFEMETLAAEAEAKREEDKQDSMDFEIIEDYEGDAENRLASPRPYEPKYESTTITIEPSFLLPKVLIEDLTLARESLR